MRTIISVVLSALVATAITAASTSPSAGAITTTTAPITSELVGSDETILLDDGTSHVSDGTGPLDVDSDVDAAMAFEAAIPTYDFGGLITPVYFTAWPNLDPAAVPTRMSGEADSGNYTGNYLAAQGWRYAQARQELAALGVDPGSAGVGGSKAVRFWRAQRDEALARGREIIRYYHILVNIAADWQTEFDPDVDPTADPGQEGFVDYGGGIVPGEAGLLMRACTPEDPADPVGDVRLNYAGHYRLIGPLDWDGSRWYCLGGTSRDSYAGTIFGLSVALEHFGDQDDLVALAGNDLMAMTDYAVKYLWNQPRPHGTVANPIIGENDLDGPVSPLFIQVPLARLHLLQTARQAARALGDARGPQYEALWAEEVANTVATGSLLDSMVVDAAGPHNAYYKYHLHLMSFYDVIRQEPDPVLREEFMRALAVLDATLTDDGNAFFEAIMFGLTGEGQRLDEAVDLHHQWLRYHAFHDEAAARGITPFVHTGRCDITGEVAPDAPVEEQPLDCVPKNQVDMIVTSPSGDDVVLPFQPGTDESLRAALPLPVDVRRLADFLWQKDPTIITGDHDVPWRGPSIDFLVTYWMLRYHSEVEVAVAPHPLPAWNGPRFF